MNLGDHRSTGRTDQDRDLPVRMGLPKGHMQAAVVALLQAAGVEVRLGARSYRPTLSWPRFETKLLKPQNVVEMLHAGSRDVGFAGADWVHELDADLVELLDTGLDPVRVVVAAPTTLADRGELPVVHPGGRPYVVASEYVRLTRAWVAQNNIDATVLRSYGATEVFPPEDADLIVDNVATGSTLSANGLVAIDTVLESSTRLFASPSALDDPGRRGLIEDMVLLLRSVLAARSRVMLDLNVTEEHLDRVISVLPCMREPTISRLHGEEGYAVRAAVPRTELPQLLLRIKGHGGTDLVVSELRQIVP